MKQLGCTSWDVVKHLLALFQESPVWRYRALAADLLIVLGRYSGVGDCSLYMLVFRALVVLVRQLGCML